MRMFTVIDAAQRSPEWYLARLGRLTGSVAGAMLAKIAKGEAAGRRNLRNRLVLERLTGRAQEDSYVSPAMLAGIEREPLAFAAYEALTGDVATRTGFLAHTVHLAGCSLDGHMGDFTKLMSIKCRQPSAHLDFLKSGVIPGDSLVQMRHELWMTGALEHDYFSWSPDFPDALQSRVVTLTRADADISGYEADALKFLAEVDAECASLATMANPARVLREAVALA